MSRVHCILACADAFRGDGEIMASPMGDVPKLGALLARATFEPDLVMTDGVAFLVDADGHHEGWMPYRKVFDVLWRGKRHVMMGAAQIDRFGNQNISCVGDHGQPKVQLLGARGAPGNTACHVTSYWVPKHSRRIFVPAVDFVCGIGTDNGAVEIRRCVTNLGVFDFPATGMRLVSLHPGATVEQVVENTGFEVQIPETVPETRGPTAQEAAWIEAHA